MSGAQVLVIGAGVAGVAAAYAAERCGAQVSLIGDRAGASCLSSGALDWLGWEREGEPSALPPELVSFSEALGAFQLAAEPARVVTLTGCSRAARGVQRGVLDVSQLAGREVGVPVLARGDWDGAALCRALAQDEALAALQVRFTPIAVNLLRFRAEENGPSRDLAAAHDAAERVAWLADRLRPHPVGAWLLGPWLGLAEPASDALTRALSVPVGETLSDIGQAAGARLGVALARLARRHAQVVGGRVTALEREGPGWLVRWEAPDGAAQPALAAERVVVAAGGLGAGGLTLTPARAGSRGGARLEVGFTTELTLELDGAPLGAASSLHGFDFEQRGRLALERVGLAAEPARGVLAAGDARAGEPRTILRSAYTGLLAGTLSAEAR